MPRKFRHCDLQGHLLVWDLLHPYVQVQQRNIWKIIEMSTLKKLKKVSPYVYVVNLITGDTNAGKLKHLKETAIAIFQKADFELHKWHSNVLELESEVKPSDESDQSFAKQQLGDGNDETKLLGLEWNKAEDTVTVTFHECEETPTKRILLRTMTLVYDPFGMVVPVTLVSKEIYPEICDGNFLGMINCHQISRGAGENG